MEWMWLCCTSFVQHRLKTELFSVALKYIYIYTTIGVCERDQRERERDKREKRKKTGIKSVRLEDCFRLHRNQQHYIWRRPTCKEPAVVSKAKTAACQNRWERQHVFSAEAPAESWVPPSSWAFVLSCRRRDNGCSPVVVTTKGAHRSFLHRPDIVEFLDPASCWRRWAPPTALGSSDIALAALGSSDTASTALGSSDTASTALGSFYITPTALGSSDIASTALGSSDTASTALGSSDIASTALGSSDIASSCADGAGSLLHRADGAGSLLHRCVPPTSTALCVLCVASYGAAVHLRIVADRLTWQLIHVRGLRPTRHQRSTNYSPTPPPKSKKQMERNVHWETATPPWLRKRLGNKQVDTGTNLTDGHNTYIELYCYKYVRFFMLILCISFNIVAFFL